VTEKCEMLQKDNEFEWRRSISMSRGCNQPFGFQCRDVYQCIPYIVDETSHHIFLNVENRLQVRLLLAEIELE
jgi:hypothetical protein